MVRTFLKVYGARLLLFVSARTNKRHHHLTTAVPRISGIERMIIISHFSGTAHPGGRVFATLLRGFGIPTDLLKKGSGGRRGGGGGRGGEERGKEGRKGGREGVRERERREGGGRREKERRKREREEEERERGGERERGRWKFEEEK
jgi:hypothetical protein